MQEMPYDPYGEGFLSLHSESLRLSRNKEPHRTPEEDIL